MNTSSTKSTDYISFWIIFGIGVLSFGFYLFGGFAQGYWGFGGHGFDEIPLLSLFFGIGMILLSIPFLFKAKNYKYGWWIAIVGLIIMTFI
mgnify:CR=1 FL=1